MNGLVVVEKNNNIMCNLCELWCSIVLIVCFEGLVNEEICY